MTITIFECPMNHNVEERMKDPTHCPECGATLIPVTYARVRGEWEKDPTERMRVDEDRTIYFLDRYWDGKNREPGIAWVLYENGWAAVVYGGDEVILLRTKTTSFPSDADIAEARKTYTRWRKTPMKLLS